MACRWHAYNKAIVRVCNCHLTYMHTTMPLCTGATARGVRASAEWRRQGPESTVVHDSEMPLHPSSPPPNPGTCVEAEARAGNFSLTQ
jgi:hypothetical protein